MFMAALYRKAKNWKQPNVHQPKNGDTKLWYSHTMEYYSEIKRKQLLIHATTWMDLRNIIPRDRNFKPESTYCTIPFIWSSSKGTGIYDLKIRTVAASEEWGQGLIEKEHEGIFWDAGNVQILKGAWVAQLHAFVKSQTMVQLRSVHFTYVNFSQKESNVNNYWALINGTCA